MMYHWTGVEALQDYRGGYIFVEADTIEEARKIVIKDFDHYLRKRFDWHFHEQEPVDEHAKEFLDEKIELLRKDLKNAPTMTAKGAIFVEGSE